ncbi:MAG: CHAT domain-containing protein, partial [Pseudonocardia sp.]|nr:CHAT domain-containing protein [Pseudonocardia sp.]
LGATDLRARAAAHRTELAELGLDMALRAGRPRQVFEWAERNRATGMLLHRPIRPPDEPGAADVLAELRGVVMRIAELRVAGHEAPGLAALARRQEGLERRIRDQSRRDLRADGAMPPSPVGVAQLAARLGDAALVEFVVRSDTLLALTVAAGRVRLRDLGPMSRAVDLIHRISFAMSRLSHTAVAGPARAAAAGLLRAAAAETDRLLVRAIPELDGRALVVVPTGELQDMPWGVLPSCALRPVTVAPSATQWYLASGKEALPGHTVVAAGPTLPGAYHEVALIAKLHGVEPLVGAAASVEAVLAKMDGAGLVHIAAHGRLDAHNPLFSSVLLADGPLFAHDVERLPRAPRTVVLASCDGGRSVVCAGDELLGLSAALLAAGSARLVAPVVPLPDLATVSTMDAFHAAMADGKCAAEALAAARERMRGTEPAEVAIAGFVCFGAGLALA